MPTPHRRTGFTLVELAISTVALSTFLLATVGPIERTRQQARVSACTARIGQHAQGMFNFASANDQSTPNAPDSPGGDLTDTYGPRGMPAFRFATADRPNHGFAFGDDGIRTMGHPTSPPTFLTHTDQWMNADQSLSQLYWVVLSQYMVADRGIDAMQQVFVSPSDEQTRSDWDAFIAWVKDDREGTLPALPEPKDNSAPIAGLEGTAPSGISNGSYLYASSMFCNPEIWLHNPRNGTPVNARLYEKWGRFDGAGETVVTVENYREVVRKNRISDSIYPSQKVAFFLERAVHDGRSSYWFGPGATIPIALFDGSARAIEPAASAIASTPRENAGPALTLHYKGNDHPGQSPFTNATEGGIEIPFVATWGGIRGRDLE